MNTASNSPQAEVFRLTNLERSKAGLPSFKRLPVLDEIAQVRAEELLLVFDHRRPTEVMWDQILAEYGVRWLACAENIAMGQESPQDVLKSWMGSQGHRANILSPAYTHLGVGVARVNGQFYWSQNFLTPRY